MVSGTDASAPRRNWFVLGLFAALVAVLAPVVFVIASDDDLGDPVPADWRVAPDAGVVASSDTIPILVNENSCASGEPANGRIEYSVTYGEETIGIDVQVRPKQSDQTCESNPDTPAVVQLDEQVGSRAITGERWRDS